MGDMYQFLRAKEYKKEKLDEILLFKNIRRSRLHHAAGRPEFFPCVEIIEWLIPSIDSMWCVINGKVGVSIASFKPTTMRLYYKFPDPEIRLKNEWLSPSR